jgi:hypothetical protein
VNTVSVVANPDGFTNRISDEASWTTELFQPGIDVKEEVCDCAVVGGFASYVFTVTNTGSEDSPDLVDVALADSILGNLLSKDNPYVTSSNADGALSVDETWTIIASRKVLTTDNDPLENTVNVSAKPLGFPNVISDSATNQVDIVHPSIDLEKLIFDPASGKYVDADSPTGPRLAEGVKPLYQFVVTNAGDVDLTKISLVDKRYVLDGLAGDLTPGNGSYDIAGLAQGKTFTLEYAEAPWQAGQQTNTATASTRFTDCCDNAVDLSDSDSANYFGAVGPGVRTPGFWGQTTGQNQWSKFWDGIEKNEPQQAGQPGFPKGDLFYPEYTNSAQPGKVLDPVTGTYATGVLVGDYNRNGMTDGQENTLFYSTKQALQLLNADQKAQQDVRYTLGRDVVAAWLNYLAGNPVDTSLVGDKDTRYQINEAVDWLQALTPGQNGDKKGDGYLLNMDGFEVSNASTPSIPASSAYWKSGIPGATGLPSPYQSNTSVLYPVDAGNAIHTALDRYNNFGFGADGAFPAV